MEQPRACRAVDADSLSTLGTQPCAPSCGGDTSKSCWTFSPESIFQEEEEGKEDSSGVLLSALRCLHLLPPPEDLLQRRSLFVKAFGARFSAHFLTMLCWCVA